MPLRRPARLRLVFPLGLLVLTAAPACGADPAPPPPAPAPVAAERPAIREAPGGAPPAPPAAAEAPGAGCALLTEAEASTALGLTMRVTSPPGVTGCVLESTPPALTVEFMAIRRTAIFDEVARSAAAQRLEGIGEAALFVPVRGEEMAQLHVVRGDRMLVVTLVATPAGPDLRALAEAFGRGVGGRL
jgi:hypothetical protein